LGSFNGVFNTIDDPSWVPFQDLLACGVRKIPIKATNTNDSTAGNTYILQFTGGGYTIGGNSITLDAAGTDISDTAGGNTVNTPFVLSTNAINVTTGTLALGSGTLTGAGGLTKSGAGTLAINTGGAGFGSTTINGGVVSINSATAVGAVTINGTGVLEINNVTHNNTISLNNGGTLRGVGAGAQENGVITIPASANVTLASGASATDVLTLGSAANSINASAGGATINVTGSGAVVLTQDNTGAAGIAATTKWNINSGGRLSISADNQLGTVPGAAVADYFTLAGGTLRTTNAANFVLGTNRGFTLGAGGGTLNLANSSVNDAGIFTGANPLNKSGSDLNLNGTSANTISAVNISSGRIFYNNVANILGTGLISVATGGTLVYLPVTANASFTLANNVTVQSGGNLASRSGTGTLTLSGLVTLPTSGTIYFNLDDATTGATTMNNAGNSIAATGDLTFQIGLDGFGTGIAMATTNATTIGTVNLNHLISGNANFSALWLGTFTSTAGGTYTFATDSDDGGVIYIDLNNDGAFASPGERIVSTGVGSAAGTVTLAAATTYNVAIGMRGAAAPNRINAKWGLGSFGTFALTPNAVDPAAQPTVWSSVYGAGTLEERAYIGTTAATFLDPISTLPGLLTQAPLPTGLLNTTATFTTNRNFIMNAQGGINASAGVLTINGTISTGLAFNGLNGGLTKTGAGTLVIGNNANTYTGPTAIRAGVLEVATIGDGGAPSRLGQSSNAASNLWFDGGTLRYNGAAAGTTDRNFTVTTAGAVIENNSTAGTSALTFTNTGVAQIFNTGARTITLQGTNTGVNTLGPSLSDNSGATTLTKAGAGTWAVGGSTSSYTGFTNVNAGILKATQTNALGSTTVGTIVASAATLELNGNFTLAAEPILIIGTGVGGVGALNATGNVILPGRVGLSGSATIGSGMAGATLTLNGSLHKEVPGNLTFVGAGNVTINSAINDADYTLTPFTALAFNGVQQVINDATVITNDFNGTTAATRTASLTGALTFVNAAAFNALFTPSIPLADNFTTVFHATLTINTPGTYSFAASNNDDGAAVWLKPLANASFVAGDLLQGIVANANTSIATRVLAAGTYTLLYAHREGTGGESMTGRIQGGILIGQTNATALAIVNPSLTTSGLDNVDISSTGTVTLAGANSYSGRTTVNSGTLLATSNTALGSSAAGTFVESGGTLALQGGVTISGEALTLNGTGAAGQPGALVNASGANTIGAASGLALVGGLSMPHSPRWYRDRLWVLNSGTGEFGYVDVEGGTFQPLAFCPGYLRGMAFVGDWAVVTLSLPRHRTFEGLPLNERLQQRNAEPQCGLYVIDLNTGHVVHTVRLEGIVTELYDVVVLPGLVRPMALGFKTTEIERMVLIDEEGQL
jgi:fibronectin-binding autotransporter adhesin